MPRGDGRNPPLAPRYKAMHGSKESCVGEVKGPLLILPTTQLMYVFIYTYHKRIIFCKNIFLFNEIFLVNSFIVLGKMLVF